MRNLNLALSLVSVLAAAGCGDDGDDHDHDDLVEINFAAKVGAMDAACGTTYTGLGSSNSSAELKDLRFYVSNLRLTDDTGNDVSILLEADDEWQTDRVALLDFEDGTAGCADTGDAATNTVVIADVPEGTYTALKFDLAVPFELNHLDLAASAPPLNKSAMFWAWAIGHRFLRVDLDVDGGANRWNIHTGSTMCNTPDMMTPPTAECARPNRAEITLDNFDINSSVVVFDLVPLLADSDITQNVDMTAFGCQSFPDDGSECTDLYPNLGMDFSTGMCNSDCGEQSAFTLQ